MKTLLELQQVMKKLQFQNLSHIGCSFLFWTLYKQKGVII
jgi:hypothetical protein